MLAARAAGAGEVYLSEPNLERAARAAGLGATAILDPTAGTVADELRERTDGQGVDVAIECAGNARALDDCNVHPPRRHRGADPPAHRSGRRSIRWCGRRSWCRSDERPASAGHRASGIGGCNTAFQLRKGGWEVHGLSRRPGFHGFRDTRRTLLGLFDRLRSARIIP